MLYKILRLKFLLQTFFSVSHNYDVINRRFKIGTQKQQGTRVSRLDVVHLISTV